MTDNKRCFIPILAAAILFGCNNKKDDSIAARIQVLSDSSILLGRVQEYAIWQRWVEDKQKRVQEIANRTVREVNATSDNYTQAILLKEALISLSSVYGDYPQIPK